eukprot:COSAG06_NODE_1859_length_8205_cov_15.172095_9_plen_118_part_00
MVAFFAHKNGSQKRRLSNAPMNSNSFEEMVRFRLYPPEEKQSFFGVVSLCLSRACLGKMFVFIYKWHLKKAVFYSPMKIALPSKRVNRLLSIVMSSVPTKLIAPCGAIAQSPAHTRN